ncbi:alpha/beta hydrolase [Streptomyces sp. M10(2022)]
MRTADGRHLMVECQGDPQGRPVFLLHGMPGSRLGPAPRGMVLYQRNMQLIAYDRPGYGGSDRLPGRRVVDVVEDVRAIADSLGLDRFAVVGRSGGAPHALACAALMPERVTRTAALVGLAPGTPRAWTGSTAWPRRMCSRTPPRPPIRTGSRSPSSAVRRRSDRTPYGSSTTFAWS